MQSRRASALAVSLRDSGLWSTLSPDTQKQNFALVEAGRYPFVLDGCEEYSFFADGEELSEGAVEEFLESLAEPLVAEGVKLALARADAETYSVWINGKLCVILEDEQPDWLGATLRPLRFLNELLVESGSLKRFHVLYAGGNDGVALLLDPAVVRSVRESGLFQLPDVPELVTE